MPSAVLIVSAKGGLPVFFASSRYFDANAKEELYAAFPRTTVDAVFPGYHVTSMSMTSGSIIYRSLNNGIGIAYATSNPLQVHSFALRPVMNASFQSKLDHLVNAITFLTGIVHLDDRLAGRVDTLIELLKPVRGFISMYFEHEDIYCSSERCVEITASASYIQVDSIQFATGRPEVILPSNPGIRTHVTALAKAGRTQYAALYAGHRLYAGTTAWSSLDARDLFTVGNFIAYTHSLEQCSTKCQDHSVFLAHSAIQNEVPGSRPFRLVSVSLCRDFQLILLCNARPSLMELMQSISTLLRLSSSVQGVIATPAGACNTGGKKSDGRDEAEECPRKMLDDLIDCVADFPRHVPTDFTFDDGVYGFLFVNDQNRVLSCFASSPQLLRNHRSLSLPDSFSIRGHDAGLSLAVLAMRKERLLCFYEIASSDFQGSMFPVNSVTASSALPSSLPSAIESFVTASTSFSSSKTLAPETIPTIRSFTAEVAGNESRKTSNDNDKVGEGKKGTGKKDDQSKSNTEEKAFAAVGKAVSASTEGPTTSPSPMMTTTVCTFNTNVATIPMLTSAPTEAPSTASVARAAKTKPLVLGSYMYTKDGGFIAERIAGSKQASVFVMFSPNIPTCAYTSLAHDLALQLQSLQLS